MDNSPAAEFAVEWACYLIEKGHGVIQARDSPPVLRSVLDDEWFRWMLLHSDEPVRALTPPEIEQIAREWRTALKAGDAGYLAVRFAAPVSKVIVLPLERARTAKYVTADKGGIPWDW